MIKRENNENSIKFYENNDNSKREKKLKRPKFDYNKKKKKRKKLSYNKVLIRLLRMFLKYLNGIKKQKKI